MLLSEIEQDLRLQTPLGTIFYFGTGITILIF